MQYFSGPDQGSTVMSARTGFQNFRRYYAITHMDERVQIIMRQNLRRQGRKGGKGGQEKSTGEDYKQTVNIVKCSHCLRHADWLRLVSVLSSWTSITSSIPSVGVRGPEKSFIKSFLRVERPRPLDVRVYTLESFKKITDRYRVILFDAYGVLKNSSGIIDGVPDVLVSLSQAGKDFYVITNDASRSPERMARAYKHPTYGELIPAEKNISSGMLTSEFLASRVKSGAVAYLGKPGAAYYVESAGLEAVPVSEVDDVSDLRALVLMDDEGFDWFGDLNKVVNIVRSANIPVIVANTDITYPVRGNEVAIAVGSLANMIEPIVRKALYRFGKPDTQIFSFAYARLREHIPDISKHEVLMVGDTLGTDILGANKFGIDTALVLSGNTQSSKFELLIGSSGIIPTYVCESIMT